MAGSPTPVDVHRDAALSDFAVAYLNDPSASIAFRVFPRVPVQKQSDRYFIWNAADTLRSDAAKRAPGTAAAERNWNLSQGSYYCDVLALAHNLSRQTVANADPAIDPEQDIVRLLLQDMMIKAEYDFGQVAFTNLWGTYATPATAWSNMASYPLADLATAIRTVQVNTGKRPNVIACGNDTWDKGLSLHEDILDRLPVDQPRIITQGFLANLLGLDAIEVSRVVYNSAVEGLSASNAFAAGGTECLVAYRAPVAGHMVATAGAAFSWTGLGGAEAQVKRYEVPKDDAYPRLEVEAAYDFKVVGSALGYLFYTCVS